MKKMKSFFKTSFANLESSLQTIILCLIPLAVFFSVLSDRRPYNYLNLAIYAVLSALILFYVLRYKSLKFDWFFIFIVLFNVIILISQLLNMRPLEFPRTILLLCLFSIVIYQFFVNTDKKEKVYTGIIVGGLIFAAFFIVYYRTQLLDINFANRLGDEFSDQNDLSKYLSIFGILSIVSAFKNKKIVWKVFFGASALVFLVLIMTTGSISNLITFTIISSILIVFNVKRQRRLPVFISICLVVALFILFLQFPFMRYYKKRIIEIINTFFHPETAKGDDSAIDRTALFLQGLKLFITKPLFGYGYDQVQYYTHGAGLFSHNNFVEVGASFGILGLVVYELLLLFPLANVFKEKRFTSEILFTTLFLFFFQIFLVIFRKKIEFLLMPLAFSIACFGYYPYLEVGFKGKSLFFEKKPAFKAIEAKRKAKSNKPKVLYVFSSSDESIASLSYCENLSNGLFPADKLFVVLKGQLAPKEATNYLVIKNALIDLRRLSFLIDDLDPETIVFDDKLMGLPFLNAFGFFRNLVCVLNKDFDKEKILLSKRVAYVALDNASKKHFDSIDKKGTFRATLIDSELKYSHESLRSFSTCYYLYSDSADKCKSVLDVFRKTHEDNNDGSFCIVSECRYIKQIESYLSENKCDFISLFNEKDDCFNAFSGSKNILLFNNSFIEEQIATVVKETSGHIVLPQSVIPTISENDLHTTAIDESSICEILNENHINRSSKKNKTISDDAMRLAYYRYNQFKLLKIISVHRF